MVDSFVIGIVGAPFGVKGFVKVHVPSGETGHLESLKDVTLRHQGAEKKYRVEGVGGTAASFVMKFKGVDSPEAAKPLAGAELVAPREAAAPLEEDEYYIEDLRGLAVVLGSPDAEVAAMDAEVAAMDAEVAAAGAEVLGELTDVLEGGGGQLAEIRLADGSRRLVPFRNEFFGEIDLAKRTAVLRGRWMLE